MKKNIIVTGANGYIGAMLIDNLLKNQSVNIVIGIDKDSDDMLLNQIIQNQNLNKDRQKDIQIDRQIDKQRDSQRFYFINQNLDNKDINKDTNKDIKDVSNTWQSKVLKIFEENNIQISDCVIIHTAWQIREIYNNRQKSWDWNIIASQNIFEFAFKNNIDKLIHFSTVASYGAFKDNKIDYYFKETDNFRKTRYLYSEEKRITEENLLKTFCLYKSNHNKKLFDYDDNILILDINKYKKEDQSEREQILSKANSFVQNTKHESSHEFSVDAESNSLKTEVVILRPAAITGPRGRFGRIRFGLQSALSGTLKKQKSIVYDIVTAMTIFMPVTDKWLRQFIHEDDVYAIVELGVMTNSKSLGLNQYEVYNISPLGGCVLKDDMAKALNKKMIKLPPQLIRFVFFTIWHLTRGKVPTAEGSWKGYSYPIAVSGQKIVDNYKYDYKYDSKEAFITNNGKYSFYINNNQNSN